MEAEVITELLEDVNLFVDAIIEEDYDVMKKLIVEGRINFIKIYTRPPPSNPIPFRPYIPPMCMACYAISFNKFEVFKFLMGRGTDFNLYAGTTILTCAIDNYWRYRKNINYIDFLLENGSDPNFQVKNDDYPLILSIKYSNIKLFELLLRYGADPNSKSLDGKTALHLVFKFKHKGEHFSFIKLLLGYRANTEDKSFLENFEGEEREELESLYYSRRKGLRS